MQSWLPDAFCTDSPVAAALVHEDDSVFESEQAPEAGLSGADEELNQALRHFKSESGFSGPQSIMSHLTKEERAQVFELVEQDIVTEFKEREEELQKNMEANLEKMRKNFDNTLELWSQNLEKAFSVQSKEIADYSARLAIQLAEKIVRTKVITDPEILIKAIETTLFKIEGEQSVIINVNPDQVELMESQPKIMERLAIKEVVADRRVDIGGCIVKTEKKEWDATIKSQLDYLNELVEEMIAVGEEPDLSTEGGSPDEPGLD